MQSNKQAEVKEMTSTIIRYSQASLSTARSEVMIRPMHRLHFAFIIALSLLSLLSSISAFTPSSSSTHQLRCNTNINQKKNCMIRRQISSSKLFYQAGGTVDTVLQQRQPPTTTTTSSTISLDTKEAIHINDTNYKSILQSNKVTLIDCYIPNCGPCRLIDKTLSCILPKYHNQLSFYKWNVNERTNSQEFMNVIRQYDMTFSKLPTLLLFVDGRPIAMRSGMASVSQIDMFLEEHLPRDEEEECVNEIDLHGEMTLCNE